LNVLPLAIKNDWYIQMSIGELLAPLREGGLFVDLKAVKFT
jgi:hypothetical protein